MSADPMGNPYEGVPIWQQPRDRRK